MDEQPLEKSGETWGYLAWRMWCAGNRNYEAIARALQEEEAKGKLDSSPNDGRPVKRAIARESKIAREAMDNDETDSLSEYIAGLEEQFGEADRIMRQGGNDFAKLGALNSKIALLEKLAAAKGVVTKRQGLKHDVEDKGPLADLMAAAKQFAPAALAEIAQNGHGGKSTDA